MLERLRGILTRRLEEPALRRALAGRVHPLDGECPGVFVGDSLALLACDGRASAALGEFVGGKSRRAACRMHGIGVPSLDALLEDVRRASPALRRAPAPNIVGSAAGVGDEPPPAEQANRRALDRLVLNVSNDCNLRCAYCYAAGGAYGGPRRLMAPETALTALDVFLAAFSRIERLQFFGGEPLLNVEVIEAVAGALARRQAAGRLAHSPRLGVVTNGTVASDRFFALAREHAIGITVSVDGPREVHDRLRGQGTFDKVRAFTSRLSAEGLTFGVEGTYTRLHVEAGIRLPDLLEFYRREFGISEVHVPWCSRPAGDPLAPAAEDLARDYREAVARSLEPAWSDRVAALAFAGRLHRAVTARAQSVYCPAGLDTLAVDAEGNVYPCFMFAGQPALRLGNVAGPIGIEASSQQVGRLLAGKSAPECEGCWARSLCFGCAGADQVASGDSFRKSSCEVMRAMADEALRRVLALAADVHAAPA